VLTKKALNAASIMKVVPKENQMVLIMPSWRQYGNNMPSALNAAISLSIKLVLPKNFSLVFLIKFFYNTNYPKIQHFAAGQLNVSFFGGFYYV
jgi:hypothetical protein